MAEYIDVEVMTLDEAIKHAKEVALDNKRQATYNFQVLEPYYAKCEQCAKEYEQLARWLEELKRYRTADIVEVVRCKDCEMHVNCLLEDLFISKGVYDGFCCAGKKVE